MALRKRVLASALDPAFLPFGCLPRLEGATILAAMQGLDGLAAYWGLKKNGILSFTADYCATHCQYGYARERPGGVWFVQTSLTKPPIGTVRRWLGERLASGGWSRGIAAPAVVTDRRAGG